jgi:DNA polymerase III alpha subunit
LFAAIHGGSATLDGWEVLTPEHQDAVSDILAPSRGALIFDEDLLRVAHLLGLPFADAERLRKALKKGEEHAQGQINQLRAAALRTGWRDTEIDVVVQWLRYIQRYTYTKGHAVAMAHVAWRVARIAAHYPAHLYAAVLDWLGSDGGGMYPALVYVTEARRHGLTVVGPTVNSPWHSEPHGTTIHAGLRTLRAAISEDTLRRLHAAAQDHPFRSIADLVGRVALTERELEQLICAGALEVFTASHRQARWDAQAARAAPQRQPALLPEVEPRGVPYVAAEPPDERARDEYATLGWTHSVPHPLALYTAALAGCAVVPVAQLPAQVGLAVTVAGIIVASRRIRTQQGRSMLFLSLCDASGVAELVVFAPDALPGSRTLADGHVICAAGSVTHAADRGVTLEVSAVRMLDR